MFTRHVSRRLAAHLDGELAPQKARETELHIEQCAHCRDEREQIRSGMEMIGHLPLVEATDTIWSSIEAAFQENQSRQAPAVRRWRLAFAAAVVLVSIGAAYWRLALASGTQWEVVRLDGSPAVGARHIREAGRIGA